MTKKLFLFIVAACMTTSLWAQMEESYLAVSHAEYVNAPVYIKNITYDPATTTISFTDTYRTDLSVYRKYDLWIYYRTEYSDVCARYSFGLDRYVFEYGEWKINPETGGWKFQDYRIGSACAKAVYGKGIETNGGDVSFDISNILPYCYDEGHNQIHISISGCYLDPVSQHYFYYETASKDYNYGFYEKSCIDIDLPSMRMINFDVPSIAYYDEDRPLVVSATIQAANKCQYFLQQNNGDGKWVTVKSGSLSAVDAREGKEIVYGRILESKGLKDLQFRMRVATFEAPYGYIHNDTSEVKTTTVYYPFTNRGAITYQPQGTPMLFWLHDCEAYEIQSEIPVVLTQNGDVMEFEKPACPVTVLWDSLKYTVKFYNADYTLLKTQEVDCGSDATAPANPTMAGMTFKKWSKDFTNVHSDLSVIAQYDLSGDYTFKVELASHKNERFPQTGFAGAADKAMVGDVLTFAVTINTPASSTIYFEDGVYKADGTIEWHGENSIGSSNAGTAKTVIKEVNVAWNQYSANEVAWQRRQVYRFAFYSAGTKVYSEPFEFDLYYRLDIQSQVTSTQDPSKKEVIFANNTCGTEFNIIARYGDTVRVEFENGNGGCMNFERLNYPSRDLETGLDEEGNAYFLCPGETEVIGVSVNQKLIIFDGVYGNGYPKQLDFSAQGFGKINGYYGEIVNCGGSILNMPEDPTVEGSVFLGWEAWNTDDYADNAYMNVPAIDDNIIGFTAQWDDIPTAPVYTVTFKDWNGTTLKTESVEEGENATPPVVGERSGYHFVGWDKSYNMITDDITITALYGEDGKTWTVTFLDWNLTVLSTQQVEDGYSPLEPNAHRNGYTFIGWSQDVTHVWSDMTVTAQYEKAEGLEEIISNTTDKAQKVLYNGQILIILPDGKVYNAAGLRIR
ncbi:MAG: InlB B-repeat-containing protein [Paludibacteraceae bacterium]|nr:InlB B-repeat-containing protein [Paludibacteraceae bacterium]